MQVYSESLDWLFEEAFIIDAIHRHNEETVRIHIDAEARASIDSETRDLYEFLGLVEARSGTPGSLLASRSRKPLKWRADARDDSKFEDSSKLEPQHQQSFTRASSSGTPKPGILNPKSAPSFPNFKVQSLKILNLNALNPNIDPNT